MIVEKHKFINSLYPDIGNKKDGQGKLEAVVHYGPIYLAILSGKYSSSNTQNYAR